MQKRILFFFISLIVCMSLMLSLAISENDLKFSTAFESLISDESLLNATDVINSVPKNYRPDQYHDLFLYMLVLERAEEKGHLSGVEVSTLAHYMSEICTLLESDCVSFYRKHTNVKRKYEEYVTMSFSAGIAAYTRTGGTMSDRKKHGKIIQTTDNGFSITWNDGSSESFQIKGIVGNRKLISSSISNIAFDEIDSFSGAYSELLGAYNRFYSN